MTRTATRRALALLTLVLFLYPLPRVTAQTEVTGNWYAMLNAMGTELPMGLTLREADGQLSGVLLSPAQTDAEIPLSGVTYDGTRLTFDQEALGASFSGVVDGDEIRGVFQQASVDFKLTFTRAVPRDYPVGDGPVTLVARPQEPRDFPYRREAVTFPGGADSVRLAGELTLPENEPPRALAILLGGSGPTDRNAFLGSQINHSTFLVLSDYLTRRGYGVLRYDDRGVGESSGDFATATSEDMARDAHAAVRFLRGREGLAELPVGLIGHSEGGMIAPVVAALDGELDFLVLMAAPALPIDQLMLRQSKDVSESMGLPPSIIERNQASLAAAYAFIKANPGLPTEDYEEGLYEVFAGQMDRLPEALRNSIKDPRAFNKQFVDGMTSPWFRYFIGFDPTDYLERLTVPTLALNGLNDVQVAGIDNLNAISAATAVAGNEDVTLLPLVGINHLLQPSETGAVSEYGTITTTIDEGVLEAIGGWLGERF